jgi:hypothetical protein
MFRKTLYDDWSNEQTGAIASSYEQDFKNLLRDKKTTFKSVGDVSQSFKDHVIHQTVKENEYGTDAVGELDQVNWSEIATAFVLNNPIWNSKY